VGTYTELLSRVEDGIGKNGLRELRFNIIAKRLVDRLGMGRMGMGRLTDPLSKLYHNSAMFFSVI
jgi:hypothetical protein